MLMGIIGFYLIGPFMGVILAFLTAAEAEKAMQDWGDSDRSTKTAVTRGFFVR